LFGSVKRFKWRQQQGGKQEGGENVGDGFCVEIA